MARPDVHLMQPTIHVQVQVRKIVCKTYNAAKVHAYWMLALEDGRPGHLIRGMGIENITMFADACRVAKEVDGTFTVTVP